MSLFVIQSLTRSQTQSLASVFCLICLKMTFFDLTFQNTKCWYTTLFVPMEILSLFFWRKSVFNCWIRCLDDGKFLSRQKNALLVYHKFKQQQPKKEAFLTNLSEQTFSLLNQGWKLFSRTQGISAKVWHKSLCHRQITSISMTVMMS